MENPKSPDCLVVQFTLYCVFFPLISIYILNIHEVGLMDKRDLFFISFSPINESTFFTLEMLITTTED